MPDLTGSTDLANSNAEESLNLDLDWRIGERSYSTIKSLLETHSHNIIVEFGGGASSVRYSLDYPEANILAIDHDMSFLSQAKTLAEAHGAGNLSLDCRPLRWQQYGLGIFQCYKRGSFPSNIDVAIIDGPPYFTFKGREACLYQIWSHLKTGALVILDDYNRSSEKSYVENWILKYGN